MNAQTITIIATVSIALSLVFGWLGSLCARTQGRQAAGFWCGLLLGPFGCVIALFLPRVEACGAAAVRRAPAMRRDKNCPLCGKLCDLRARSCPECGHPLS